MTRGPVNFKINSFHREVVAIICEHIESNLDGDLTIVGLAKKAGYDRSHFSRIFIGVTGESIQRYVSRLRIDTAAQRLRDTDDTVATVAHAVGYESVAGFVKAFIARHGRPPSIYRGSARATAKRAAAHVAQREVP